MCRDESVEIEQHNCMRDEDEDEMPQLEQFIDFVHCNPNIRYDYQWVFETSGVYISENILFDVTWNYSNYLYDVHMHNECFNLDNYTYNESMYSKTLYVTSIEITGYI